MAVDNSAVSSYCPGRDRLEWIEHRDHKDAVLLRIEYVWNLDNTVDTRTEYDATGQTATQAVVTFWYDNRQRLRRERRVVDGSTTVYDITYEYDELGNRTEKLDSAADVKTCYVYETNWDAGSNVWSKEGDRHLFSIRHNRAEIHACPYFCYSILRLRRQFVGLDGQLFGPGEIGGELDAQQQQGGLQLRVGVERLDRVGLELLDLLVG